MIKEKIISFKPMYENISFSQKKTNKQINHTQNADYTSIFKNNNGIYPYVFISKNSEFDKKSFCEKDEHFLKQLQQKYAEKLNELISKYTEDDSHKLGIEIIKLTNECQKELLNYASKNNINYIDFENTTTKELKETTEFIDEMFQIIEDNNPDFFNSQINSKTSFKSKKIKNIITKEQREEAHLKIHMSSLMCAGVSAFMGEGCLTGADLPLLIAIETKMFKDLCDNFNVPVGIGMIHASTYMYSAGITGGRILKWLNTVIASGGHIAALPTAGTGNAAITTYLRLSNGALSALLCESMGWAFVKDYKNGRMNIKDKIKEASAFFIFRELLSSFDTILDIEKPAEIIQDKTSELLGRAFAQNVSKENAEFIQAAMKFLSYNPMTKAAKGIELITPAIAAHLVENEGKLNQDFLEYTIKGSLYSIVCSDLLGEITDGTIIKEKSKKIMGYLMNDKDVSKMIENSLKMKGITNGGAIILNKEAVKSLESVYNELAPKIAEVVKEARVL